MKNIQNLNAYKIGSINFCRQRPPPLKTVISFNKRGFAVFSKNIVFFEKFVL